jgi:hypothetical protein
MKTTGTITFVFVLVCMCFSASSWAHESDQLQLLQTENEQLKAQLEQLKARIAALEKSNTTLQVVNEDLEVEKKNLTELAGMTAQGKRIASRRALIETLYNDQQHKTIVRSKPEKLTITRGSGADHFISAAYSYRGREMNDKPQTIRWYIQTKFSGGIYRGRDQIELDIDGQIHHVAITDYKARRRRTGAAGKAQSNRDDEVLAIAIDAALLRQLARAGVVTGRIGHIRFELTLDQIATFKALRKRIELGM